MVAPVIASRVTYPVAYNVELNCVTMDEIPLYLICNKRHHCVNIRCRSCGLHLYGSELYHDCAGRYPNNKYVNSLKTKQKDDDFFY